METTTLLIDLDDTLYPATSGLWEAIRRRIDLYVETKFSLSHAEASDLRRNLFMQYGTTLRGLQTVYSVDAEEYLAFVHDVPLDHFIQPDPALRQALLACPQRKVIFTNADSSHARRVLNVLSLNGLFEQILDIHVFDPYCKPMPEAFTIALKLLGETPPRCVVVDDSLPNLATAHDLGMHTVWVTTKPPAPPVDVVIPTLGDLPRALALN
jgi:putative hydrolase of the HAD superfamily